MSYDVWMEVDAGGHEPARLMGLSENYTRNVSPMWTAALLGRNLGDVIEKAPDAASLVPDLFRAIGDMEARADYYRTLEPDNGWGDYAGALRFLRVILTACQRHPRARVGVSR